jgi:hypothetical protein
MVRIACTELKARLRGGGGGRLVEWIRPSHARPYAEITVYIVSRVAFDGGHFFNRYAIGKRHAMVGCTVRGFGDGARNFSVATFPVYGVSNPSAMLPLLLKQAREDVGSDALNTRERIETLSRPQVVGPGLRLPADEDPFVVSVASCMWDMNPRSDNMGGWRYSASVVRRYGAGVLEAVASARHAYPSSPLWWATCKPMAYAEIAPRSRRDRVEVAPELTARGAPSRRYIDGTHHNQDVRQNSTQTRSRRLQVALDSAARMALTRRGGLVEGIIDSSAVLIGYASRSRLT